MRRNGGQQVGGAAQNGCATKITGSHNRPLTIGAGVTCLNQATISGPVKITAGAVVSIQASTLGGPPSADSPAGLTVCGSTVSGPAPVTDVAVGIRAPRSLVWLRPVPQVGRPACPDHRALGARGGLVLAVLISWPGFDYPWCVTTRSVGSASGARHTGQDQGNRPGCSRVRPDGPNATVEASGNQRIGARPCP